MKLDKVEIVTKDKTTVRKEIYVNEQPKPKLITCMALFVIITAFLVLGMFF